MTVYSQGDCYLAALLFGKLPPVGVQCPRNLAGLILVRHGDGRGLIIDAQLLGLAARRAFQLEKPCPVTGKTHGACPGYVVDHIIPLACCGADHPSNMQWQTREDAKAKDRTELDCKQYW